MSDNKETSEENIEKNIEGEVDEKITLTKEDDNIDTNEENTESNNDVIEQENVDAIESDDVLGTVIEDESKQDDDKDEADIVSEQNDDKKEADIVSEQDNDKEADDKEADGILSEQDEKENDDILLEQDEKENDDKIDDDDDVDHDVEFSKEINSDIKENDEEKESRKVKDKSGQNITLLRVKRIFFDRQDELKEPRDKTLANIVSYVKIIFVAFILAYLINTFVLSNTTIPSSSMENTIMKNDRLFGFRWAYTFSEPKRGDIIIFKYPDNEKENYIKRIIGLPGDKVEIKAGVVYVNGEKIEENYLKETPASKDFGPYNVPEDSYFVLGDNRNCSKDARYWKNTYVHKDQIVAKAIFKYFPKIEFM